MTLRGIHMYISRTHHHIKTVNVYQFVWHFKIYLFINIYLQEVSQLASSFYFFLLRALATLVFMIYWWQTRFQFNVYRRAGSITHIQVLDQ